MAIITALTVRSIKRANSIRKYFKTMHAVHVISNGVNIVNLNFIDDCDCCGVK